jgi:hypothetical protein
MFAAIAIGVGIDFAIHLIDKLREALAIHDEDIYLAVDHALPLTARACYFNSGALAVGFAVLMTSELSMLQRFGGLVTLAAVCSYLMALIMVPALFRRGSRDQRRSFPSRAARCGERRCLRPAGGRACSGPRAASAPRTCRRSTARPSRRASPSAPRATARDGWWISSSLTGAARPANAVRWCSSTTTVTSANTRFTYLAPKSVKEVTFLSHDRLDPTQSDDRWLFLPATRKVRRIPASDRGDYFLGTDFTYEDIQSEFKLSLSDYNFVLEDTQITDGGRSTSCRARRAPTRLPASSATAVSAPA